MFTAIHPSPAHNVYDATSWSPSYYQPQVVNSNHPAFNNKNFQAPVLQQSYQAPAIQQSSSPELDSRLVVPSFNPSDDPIGNLNKLIAFMSTTFGPRFPQTNNQLRTSSNPRNQATNQHGRDPKQLAFLADNGDTIIPTQASQEIPTPATFQTDDLDAFILIVMMFPRLRQFSWLIFLPMTQAFFQKIDITNDSNIISYEQYLQETETLVVQSTSSSTQQDELLIEETLELAEESRYATSFLLVKHNRDAHVNYLKPTQENADTLREIIEHARELRPLDSNLDSACKFVTRIQELLVYVNETCPSTTPVSNKLVAVTPMNSTRKDRVSSSTEASGSNPMRNTKKDRILQTSCSNKKTNKVEAQPRIAKSNLNNTNHVSKTICNENVKHSVLNANSELVCATCHECMFDAIHDLCVNGYINDVNARVKSKSVKSRSAKSIKKEMWKPTGKVYTKVGYTWKPIGRTFTIVENACPLTRIISTNVVPPRKYISATPNPCKNEVPKFLLLHLLPVSISGTVRFENDQIAKIMGYGNYQLGNVTISRVYYVEGLRHNLLFVGQFYDPDLEVAFRKHKCYVWNLDGDDLLSGSRDTNLYTILLDDMLKSSPICLLSKASKTKSWLWHRQLSHLNFGTLNQLAKQGLVRGLPKLKFEKDHLCSACSLGKSKKSSYKPKADDTNQEKLYLLHMDLCGPMRVKFLRSKDEAPEVIIKCLKQIQVRMNATVRNVRTDNGTEFVNQTLRKYYENVRISHQTSVARTPRQNDIVERQNRTLVEDARTMLIFPKAPLFLWAEAINTACYTQNRSLISICYNKTPYELKHDKKLDLSYLYVFGSLYYLTNDNEDLGKLKAKADIGIFVGYAPAKKSFYIYNKRT
ncbi:retrovirus-related pol polyprotein from transposon TNT 1-94 [Tanacetum coccineum]